MPRSDFPIAVELIAAQRGGLEALYPVMSPIALALMPLPVKRADAVPYLKPYLPLLARLRLSHDLKLAAENAASKVAWMRSPQSVETLNKPPRLGAADTRKRAELDMTNATVFLQLVVMFSGDMKYLIVGSPVSVYARGARRPGFLDGGGLAA